MGRLMPVIPQLSGVGPTMKCRYKNQQRFIVSMLMLAINLVDFGVEPNHPDPSSLNSILPSTPHGGTLPTTWSRFGFLRER